MSWKLGTPECCIDNVLFFMVRLYLKPSYYITYVVFLIFRKPAVFANSGYFFHFKGFEAWIESGCLLGDIFQNMLGAFLKLSINWNSNTIYPRRKSYHNFGSSLSSKKRRKKPKKNLLNKVKKNVFLCPLHTFPVQSKKESYEANEIIKP